MQAHQPPEFGRDKAPLSGGGCNLYVFGVFKHRAFRLARSVARAVGDGQGVGLCGPIGKGVKRACFGFRMPLEHLRQSLR